MSQKLSTNECQAEVAFTVLALMLQRMHPAEVFKLKKEAMVHFVDIGDDGILDEARVFFQRAQKSGTGKPWERSVWGALSEWNVRG
ncbi:MAG: hypothetical protein EOP84_00280 [Verrucomicrobiaceae bacterium]|nr:MAG: hypothetical protein EOP84_00280 [Verrucomicrobiaceae bacterium]